MEITLNCHGNEKQLLASEYWIDDTTEDICYGGSKGSGKSFLGCSLIFGDALIYPETHYFIARKELNDLRKFTIPSIHEVFDIWGTDKRYYTYNGQDNYFELYNKSRVYLLAAKYLPSDPDYSRFGSMQMTRGWIEEAGQFEESAKNNLSASIGRWKNDVYNLKGKLIQTCNPSKNYLYPEYYKKNKDKTIEPHKKFIQALPSDNKKLPKGYIERLHNTLGKSEKERLLFGNWEYSDDPMLLFADYDKIIELFTNDFLQNQYINSERYITADIAYEGSDLFVIGVWSGLMVIDVIVIEKISELLVGSKIEEIRQKYHVPKSHIVYDADGLKRFVKHSAESGYLKDAKQFFNGGKPIGKENYKNLKAQCYFKLSDYVSKSKIFIKHNVYREKIIEELEQIKQLERNDDNEPLRLEKKVDLKERLGRSPDFADMIMMRMFFELKEVQEDLESDWDY